MDGKVSQFLWRFVASSWMCVEIGQFLETRAGFAHNALFWPFWIAVILAIFLGAQLIDLTLSP